MSETAEKPKLRTINPEDFGRFTEKVEIDVNANAFQRPAPIPDALYVGKLALQTGNYAKPVIQGGEDKNGNDYFLGNFYVALLESATDGVPSEVLKGKSKKIQGRVTTFETQDASGRKTNEMAAVAIAAGAVPNGNTLGEVAFAFDQAVRGGATVGVLTEWRAQKKDEKGQYNTVRRGMTNFPKNEDGSYNPTITVDGQELTARAEIKAIVRLSV